MLPSKNVEYDIADDTACADIGVMEDLYNFHSPPVRFSMPIRPKVIFSLWQDSPTPQQQYTPSTHLSLRQMFPQSGHLPTRVRAKMKSK